MCPHNVVEAFEDARGAQCAWCMLCGAISRARPSDVPAWRLPSRACRCECEQCEIAARFYSHGEVITVGDLVAHRELNVGRVGEVVSIDDDEHCTVEWNDRPRMVATSIRIADLDRVPGPLAAGPGGSGLTRGASGATEVGSVAASEPRTSDDEQGRCALQCGHPGHCYVVSD